MNRKPYYVLRPVNSNFKLHEGIGRDKYPNSGNAIQLYLTDEEVQKYNSEAIKEIIQPYTEISMKRCMYIPAELILYAISAVIFGK
jgi:hypothetical protein